jgi:hypothetical protein
MPQAGDRSVVWLRTAGWRRDLAADPPRLIPTSGSRDRDSVTAIAQELDIEAMIARFRERADAVRRRGIPPVEGDERRRIMRQMQLDFQDFAMLGDASGTLDDGILTLRLDLRPAAPPHGPPAHPPAEGGDD